MDTTQHPDKASENSDDDDLAALAAADPADAPDLADGLADALTGELESADATPESAETDL